MPDSHNMTVQELESIQNILGNTIQEPVCSLYIAVWLDSTESDPPISEAHACWNSDFNFSKRRKKTQQSVLCSHTPEYTVVISTKYNDQHS